MPVALLFVGVTARAETTLTVAATEACGQAPDGSGLCPAGSAEFAAPEGRHGTGSFGANVSVDSNDRYRGHDYGNRRPIAGLDLSYDDPSGLYLGSAVTGVATAHDGARLLGGQVNLGYSRAVGRLVSIDAGLLNVSYTRFAGNPPQHYFEGYVGFITRRFASHIYYSPNYLRPGVQTIYVDIDGVTRLGDDWRLAGHFGTLVELANPAGAHTIYDWRIGVTRQINMLELSVARVGGSARPDFVDGQVRSRGAFVVGASYAF